MAFLTFAFKADTPEGVQRALYAAFVKRMRVRVFYGDRTTGRQWLEDFEVIGYVEPSVGHSKVALLVHNRRSSDGDAIATDCVLRIVDVRSGRDLYRAENYALPVLAVCKMADPYTVNDLTLTHEVWRGVPYKGELVARFTSETRARNWVAWQHGKRMRRT